MMKDKDKDTEIVNGFITEPKIEEEKIDEDDEKISVTNKSIFKVKQVCDKPEIQKHKSNVGFEKQHNIVNVRIKNVIEELPEEPEKINEKGQKFIKLDEE